MLFDTNVLSDFLRPDAAVRLPSTELSEGDLLVAATASFHEETLITFDAKLVENLHEVGFVNAVLLPRE